MSTSLQGIKGGRGEPGPKGEKGRQVGKNFVYMN